MARRFLDRPRLAVRTVALGCTIMFGTTAAASCSSSSSPAATTPSVADTTTSSSSSTSTTTSTTLPPTTTTEPFVTAGAIVVVANSSSKSGAANLLSTDLAAFGFTVGPPTNGFGPDDSLVTSKIYAKPGSERVADSLSRLLAGIPVMRMPTPAWISGGTAALGDTSILVMLGNDLAGRHLGEIALSTSSTTAP